MGLLEQEAGCAGSSQRDAALERLEAESRKSPSYSAA